MASSLSYPQIFLHCLVQPYIIVSLDFRFATALYPSLCHPVHLPSDARFLSSASSALFTPTDTNLSPQASPDCNAPPPRYLHEDVLEGDVHTLVETDTAPCVAVIVHNDVVLLSRAAPLFAGALFSPERVISVSLRDSPSQPDISTLIKLFRHLTPS